MSKQQKPLQEHSARFQVGDWVMYPFHGVGKIEKIEERTILNHNRLYYHVKLHYSGMKVMIPISESENLRIRKLSSPHALQNVLEILKEESQNFKLEWKARYHKNQKKVKEGSIRSLSEVVRDLFLRNQIKELSRGEKELYDNAFQILSEELSYSQELPSKSIKSMILERLKNHKAN